MPPSWQIYIYIYADWAFICSHGRMRKMAPSSRNHSLAMIGLFTLAITNESSVHRNQVQRRRWLMHAAFAYVSVTIRSAPVGSVRTIVNRRTRRVLAWIRNGRRGKSVPLEVAAKRDFTFWQRRNFLSYKKDTNHSTPRSARGGHWITLKHGEQLEQMPRKKNALKIFLCQQILPCSARGSHDK